MKTAVIINKNNKDKSSFNNSESDSLESKLLEDNKLLMTISHVESLNDDSASAEEK